MKKYFFPLLGLLCLSAPAFAQTELEDENDFQTRLSIGIDKKITKGFHFTAEEEFRFENGSSAIDRFQTSFGLSYKVNSFLKAGLSYTLLNPYKESTSAFTNPRHRFSFDLTGSYKTALWTFSLKERFQLTHRSGSFNAYQSNANAMVLKSRLTAKYRGFGMVKPYAFAELRNTLNAPSIKATYDSSTGTYLTSSGSEEGDAGWFISGWDNMYVNRIRGALGCDIDLSKQHGLSVFFLTDYYTDKSVDANKAGTKLKSYTVQHGLNLTLGLGYTYSF